MIRYKENKPIQDWRDADAPLNTYSLIVTYWLTNWLTYRTLRVENRDASTSNKEIMFVKIKHNLYFKAHVIPITSTSHTISYNHKMCPPVSEPACWSCIDWALSHPHRYQGNNQGIGDPPYILHWTLKLTEVSYNAAHSIALSLIHIWRCRRRG